MVDRKTRPQGISASLFTAHQSYVPGAESRTDLLAAYIVNREIPSIGGINAALIKDPTALDELFQKEHYTLKDAYERSAAEKAGLTFLYPDLLSIEPSFLDWFTFVRTAELKGGYARGGNVLLVGSGTTAGEVLATHIIPATRDEIVKVLGEEDSSEKWVANKGLQVRTAIPLVDGQIIAVEPDTEYKGYFEEMMDELGLDLDRVRFVNSTIGEAIINGEIPLGLDTIFWNRIDPKIVYPFDSKGRIDRAGRKKGDKDVEKLLKNFLSKLKAGGRLMLTIGIGNSPEEYTSRVNFLESCRKIFAGMNVRTDPEMEFLYKGRFKEALLWGGLDVGIVGCVVATKTA
ncbi:MAG TPA: hypothetical protein VLE91_05020 [Candidatus Saccharimonadales bacterium]|nr:hypothetical protein [Candidatus Saccharimonadales bacterium]